MKSVKTYLSLVALAVLASLTVNFTALPILALGEENVYISEDFEDCALTSYQGGTGIQSAEKPVSGGRQTVVEENDGKKLNICISYVYGATAHDSFIQTSSPISLYDKLFVSCRIRVEDSSKGNFGLYILGGGDIPAVLISNGIIRYLGGEEEEYTEGETFDFSVTINSVSGEVKIYKDGSLVSFVEDVTKLNSIYNLSSIRLRIRAQVYDGENNVYHLYVDNIIISNRKDLTESVNKTAKGNIIISENFEDRQVTSYAGGEGIQCAVKPASGGRQTVVEENDGKKLSIGISYVYGATAHDSFIQTSSSISGFDKLLISSKLRIEDSSKGRVGINLLCGGELSAVWIVNDTINYVGGKQERYTNGEIVEFSVVVNSVSGQLRVYKNGVLMSYVEDVTKLNSIYNLSSIRLRIQAQVYEGENNVYNVYVDDIYVGAGDTDNEFYPGNLTLKKVVYDHEVDATYLKSGLYNFEYLIGYDGTEPKSVKLIFAQYNNTVDCKRLINVSITDYTLTPGFGKMNMPLSISDSCGSDTFKVFMMPEGDYKMIFSQIANPEAGRFTNPDGNEMVRLLCEKNPDNMHPRLWITQSDIQRLKTLVKNDETAKEWYRSIKADATKLLNNSLPTYEDDDPQRLVCSQSVVAAIPLLSLIYLVDGDEAYAYRAYEYMRTVSEFPDWAPYHFLDTSNITTAVSIGYDWLYDYLGNIEGSHVYFEEKIAEKGVAMGRDAYLKTLSTGNYWWVDCATNWNVCCNSGMAVGAMAIGDVEEYSSLCAFVLEMGLDSLQKMMPSFVPDGAWFEGPSYWFSTIAPLCSYVSALKSAFDTDFGIMQSEGLSNTAYYPIMNIGTEIAFNLHDAGAESVDAPQFWYLAKTYGDKSIAGYRFYQLTEKGCKPTYKDLLWYDCSLIENDFDKNIIKDGYFRNLEVATFRNSYKGNNINFAGLHGGKTAIEHGQLDAGTFVYEAMGERWAIDLGGEAYNMHNYWIMDDIEKSRWGYYRNRAEGHNTLVINPGALADQDLDCDSKIDYFASNANEGVAITDISSAYKKHTTCAKRGILINKGTGNFVVQDEVFLKKKSDIYWFMHTKAEITLQDNDKTAVLKQNGKTLIVTSNGAGSFTIMSPTPMETSPNPDGWQENMDNDGSLRSPTHQNANEGVRKLAIVLKNVIGDVTINVSMGPEETYIKESNVTKLNMWR